MVDKKELRILYNRIIRSIEDLNNISRYLLKASTDFFSNVNNYERCLQSIETAIEIINLYNALNPKEIVSVSCNLFEMEGDIKIEDDTTKYSCIADIRRLEDALYIIRDYLNFQLSPNLNENEKREIEGLSKELEKLQEQLERKIFYNLKEALKELENNHYLASCLISGRIITYVIEYLQREEKSPQEDKINKLIEKLKGIGFIGEIENEKEAPKFLLDASKSARDATSHDLDVYINASDAFRLVANTFRICHFLIKYQKFKENK